MTLFPLDQACPHIATPQEQQRDRDYQACNAQPGQPCTWARRYDGLLNPRFHAERLEAASLASPFSPAQSPERLREEALETGLV
jgi:hypothetical protein